MENDRDTSLQSWEFLTLFLPRFRAQHPDASGVFSYYSQRVVANRPANRGLRLDYVLATPDLFEDGAAPALVDSFVLSDADTPQLADHTPVGATFVLE